jgi:DNA-binding response OmpR family regulator
MVLLAEPDPALRRMLTQRLADEGCVVRPVESTDLIFAALAQTDADVVVVAASPGSDVIQALRERSHAVVIPMLPRDTNPMEALDALDLGADDFVVKPFSPRELVSRLHARLRRFPSTNTAGRRRFVFDGLVIDETQREVMLRGESIVLPAKEFELLAFLAASPRQVFTRGQLMAQVWGTDVAITTATITEHIRRLRNRIEDDAKNPRWIETVWSVGYRFNPAGATQIPERSTFG